MSPDAEQLAGAVREGLAILLSAGVGQRAEVAEDHRAHGPHTDAPETPRGARASGEAVPCGGSGSAKDQVAVVRGAACFAGAFCGAAFPAALSRWRFVQAQTTQDVIAVRVSAQRGQGIQAAQQSRGRCGAFQVLNRRQGLFKTLDAAFEVRSTRKVRILERYLRVHLGLSGRAATGNVYPGRANAVGRRVRIARAETQRRHQSVNVTGAGSGVPRRSTRGPVTGSCGGGFVRWRFVQTQTTQDVIAVRVSAQRGQGIQAAQQSRGRCGAFQVLNRRQGLFKTLDAAFEVRSTRKVRILERYLRVHLGLSGRAATGNVYPGRANAVGRRVRIARAETQRRHQSVDVTGAGSGVPRRSTLVRGGVAHAGADGERGAGQSRSGKSHGDLAVAPGESTARPPVRTAA
ncbi:hypothetical protein SAMN06264365_108220 [Actinoplanes regularis]|uniref:Uncharacterized protein n=1 Tax=Actinoplanes regularis TaxID=52697 RepID=A0A239B0Q6_9ACTN|nr:hypothetical protein SAMN06264365_108220 [Actinoplanes regularis]